MDKLCLEKVEKPETKLATFVGSRRMQGNSRKASIYFCFIDYAKTFDYVDHTKLQEILKEMRVPDYSTCLLINLYAATSQNQTWRNRLVQSWERSMTRLYNAPCLFNFQAGYITRNAGQDESHAEQQQKQYMMFGRCHTFSLNSSFILTGNIFFQNIRKFKLLFGKRHQFFVAENSNGFPVVDYSCPI